MSQYLTVMTRKGQITVPAEIRRALGLKEGDRVAVSLENGHACLVRYGSVTARTAGIFAGENADVPPGETLEEWEEIAFERDVADEVVLRMEQ